MTISPLIGWLWPSLLWLVEYDHLSSDWLSMTISPLIGWVWPSLLWLASVNLLLLCGLVVPGTASKRTLNIQLTTTNRNKLKERRSNLVSISGSKNNTRISSIYSLERSKDERGLHREFLGLGYTELVFSLPYLTRKNSKFFYTIIKPARNSASLWGAPC